LAAALAIFARLLFRATPTEIGSPTRSRTSRRSRRAISTGVPPIRSRPRTSRKASSIESRSTSGAVSSKMSATARLASTYAVKSGETATRGGHSRRATRPPIAERTPYARAS
jgi:hypothetical protein